MGRKQKWTFCKAYRKRKADTGVNVLHSSPWTGISIGHKKPAWGFTVTATVSHSVLVKGTYCDAKISEPLSHKSLLHNHQFLKKMDFISLKWVSRKSNKWELCISRNKRFTHSPGVMHSPLWAACSPITRAGFTDTLRPMCPPFWFCSPDGGLGAPARRMWSQEQVTEKRWLLSNLGGVGPWRNLGRECSGDVEAWLWGADQNQALGSGQVYSKKETTVTVCF